MEVEEATTLVTHRQTQADMKMGGMVTKNWLLGGEVGVVLGVEAKEEAEKVEVEGEVGADGLEMGWLFFYIKTPGCRGHFSNKRVTSGS